MKYIRTENGVYELKAQKTSNCFYIYDKQYGFNLLFDKQELKKFRQADTIEELCDEFVVWQEDYGNPISMPLTEKERYEQMKNVIKLGLFGKMNCWIKLAIWTDKGLIYVAKMNEKGELELL